MVDCEGQSVPNNQPFSPRPFPLETGTKDVTEQTDKQAEDWPNQEEETR